MAVPQLLVASLKAEETVIKYQDSVSAMLDTEEIHASILTLSLAMVTALLMTTEPASAVQASLTLPVRIVLLAIMAIPLVDSVTLRQPARIEAAAMRMAYVYVTRAFDSVQALLTVHHVIPITLGRTVSTAMRS